MKLIVTIKTKGKTYEKSMVYPMPIENCENWMITEDGKMMSSELYEHIMKDLFGKDEVEGYEFVPESKNDEMIEEFENESNS